MSKRIARDARPDVALLFRLVDQSVSANRRWIDHVYTQPGADARARGLLAHIVLGERIWFERIEGGQTTRETFQELEKDELLSRLDHNRRDYLRLIETRLDEVVEFRRDTGVEYHARVSDALLHLLTHGVHHRGQLAAHYASRTLAYPSTDHIDYLIENRL